MIAAAKKYGKLFTVHQNRRWDEDYLTIRKIVESGDLGHVFRIESRVHGSRGIPGGWREEKAHGGGMVLDWGVHLLDQMLTMMHDYELESVYATLDHLTNFECDEGFTALVRYKNGPEWLVEVKTCNYIEMPRWYAFGDGGSAEGTHYGVETNALTSLIPRALWRNFCGLDLAGNPWLRNNVWFAIYTRPGDVKSSWFGDNGADPAGELGVAPCAG